MWVSRRSGQSGLMSTALYQCLLTMSTWLSTIQPLLQQRTKFWKIPAQTDVTCCGVLLQLCSGPSILLINCTIWCRFWLISAPLLSESNQRKNRIEEKTARLLHPSQVAYICGRSSVRDMRPTTYATQTVIM